MNFICDKCKQKYHVADDKLAGRAVTRFRCKKCDNVIELHAPTSSMPSPAPATSSTAPAPSATVSSSPVVRATTHAMPIARPAMGAKPRATTSTGPSFGGGASARSATMTGPGSRAGTPGPTSAASPSDAGWYAGIRDVPVGPLTRKELGVRVAAGDITADTLVWREGLDDWRPLVTVAELGEMLRAPAAESSRPVTARQATMPPTRSARPSLTAEDDDDEATRVSGLDPSLAGVAKSLRPVVKAVDRPAPALDRPKPAAGGLSPLARAPVASKVGTPLSTKAPERPAEPAEPVKLVEARVEKPSETSAIREVSNPGVTVTPSATRTSEPALPKLEVPPAEARVEPSATRSASISATPEDDLPDDMFSSVKASTLSTPMSRSERSDAALALEMPVAPVLATPALLPETPPPAQPPPVVALQPPPRAEPRGLPASAWLLMAGVLVVGVGSGIYIGRSNPVQPQLPPIVRPEPRPQPVEPDVQPVVAPQTPRAEADAAVDASPASVDAHTAGDGPLAPHHHPIEHMAHDGGGALGPQLSAADRALLANELRGAQGGGTGGPVGNTTLAGEPGNSGAPTSAQTPAARGAAIAQHFRDSHSIDNCWQAALRQNPALHSTTVTIDVGVDARGHFTTVSVTDSPDPHFETCLRSRIAGIAPIGAGTAMDARISVALTVNN